MNNNLHFFLTIFFFRKIKRKNKKKNKLMKENARDRTS